MNRLLPLLAVASLAALASACDVSPPAATVNGTVISQSTFDTEVATLASSPAAQCALELQGASLPSISGVSTSSVTTAFAAGELSSLVEQALLSQALARRHATVTTADLAAARADVAAELVPPAGSTSSPCGAEGNQLLSELPRSFVSEQVAFQAEAERLLTLVAHVSVSRVAVAHYYLSHPADFAEDCLSGILVSTQAEANAIRSQIVSGAESFAAEARAHSLDTQSGPSGGSLGCVPATEITNPQLIGVLLKLKVGQVSQPLFEQQATNSGGWVLIELTGRPEEPLTAVAAGIRRQILSAHSSALQRELTKLIRRAKVNIDPRYGKWSSKAGVTPPSPPPAKDLLSPSADQPATGATGVAGASAPSAAPGGGA